MRFDERPTVAVEVHVEAPPEQVWPVVADIATPIRFSSELQEVTWLDDAGGAAPGARFKGRNLHPARGEWETTSTIVACEPGRVFAWAVGDPERPSALWRFELEPAEGGTLLRQWAQMGPGPSGVTMIIEQMPDKEEAIIERRLGEWRQNMVATVEGVKGLAEGGHP
ncbi:MAG TPA: SRPBCC family protein [Acidimicrobiia bacterium]